MIDRLFDLLNSRNPHGKAFKKPLTSSDRSARQATLESTTKYLLAVKSIDGVPIIRHPRKTFVLGFVITIKSTLEMAKQMLTLPEKPFKYVLTYKFSQDHIELLFSCIGTKGGWNNNPNALRTMLLGNAVKASVNGNCQAFDDNQIILIFRTRKHQAPPHPNQADPKVELHHINRIHEMAANLDLTKSSHAEFVENILEYISGFLITKLLKQVKCSSCINNLTATSSFK